MLPQMQGCNQQNVLEYLMHDKKFMEGKIYFILPTTIGKVEKFQIQVIDLIKEVLNKIVN